MDRDHARGIKMKWNINIVKAFLFTGLLLSLMNTIARTEEATINIGFVGDFCEWV